MELEQTCRENTLRLSPHIERIAAGEMSDTLEPFAKAYLGLYYQLDNTIPPRQRVASLASAELATAIMQGMQSLLLWGQPATALHIGQAHADGEGLGSGYVLLAAVEEYCEGDATRVLALADENLAALLCYQLLHGSYQPLPWHEVILQQGPALAIEALQEFWSPLLHRTKERLPGLQTLIRGQGYPQLAMPLSLHLLEHWPQADAYTLRRLMQWALSSDETERLLAIAAGQLTTLPRAEIRRKVYWLVTAFLCAPQAYADALSGYIGRSKEKVLPLLDYVQALLQDPAIEQQLTAMDLARLLRIIAPIFVRNEGRGGLLDDNSSKVLWLFAQLQDYPASERMEAVRWLQGVRVMRCYGDILQQMSGE